MNCARLEFILVNKANLVQNLFLVYLSICTCFGRLCAHHQEKQLCLCDTWYLLFCVNDCLVCTLHTRESQKIIGDKSDFNLYILHIRTYIHDINK
jgi:hypothetical protein